jgi:hypothetical protein
MTKPFSSLIDISSFFIGVLINLLLVALICYYFKRKFDNIEMAQSEQAKILYDLIQEKNNQINVIKSSSEPSTPVSGGGLNFFSVDDMDRLQNTNVVSETVNVLGLGDAEELSQHSSDGEDSDSDSDSESEDEEENVQEVEVENKNVLYTIQPTPVLEEISEEKIVVEKLGQDEPEAEPEAEEEVTTDVEPEMLQQDTDVESEVEQEIENYEKMTIKELKEIISQRNIPLKKNMLKKEMIEVLQQHDQEEEPVVIVSEDGGVDLSEETLVIEE